MEAVEFFNQDFYKRIIRFVICGTTNGITKWVFCDRCACIIL
jgi:putative flippase GtrA